MGEWTFFSNHGHVLVCLARDNEARLRDVAVQVGITERAVQKIVRDMQDAGYLEITKHGRRNRYRINNRKTLRHPLQSGCTVGQLLQLLSKQQPSKTKTPSRPQRAPDVIPGPKAEPPETFRHAGEGPAKPVEPPVAEEAPNKDETPRPERAKKDSPETDDGKDRSKKLEQGQLF